jgi:hypothetical protein
MSRESEIYAILNASAPLLAVLTGGLYKAEDVGVEGISRETTPAAFSSGYLEPCALIKQRAETVTNDVVEFDSLVISTTQIVEIWLYEDRGYTNLDAARPLIMGLLNGAILTTSFELQLANMIDRQRDEGALKGASLARMDWQVWSIIQ